MYLEDVIRSLKKLKKKICCLVIQGADHENRIVTLEESTVIPTFTADDADTLTPANGTLIYVTDTNGNFLTPGFYGYEEGVWAKII